MYGEDRLEELAPIALLANDALAHSQYWEARALLHDELAASELL
jgi:hypothetical protein